MCPFSHGSAAAFVVLLFLQQWNVFAIEEKSSFYQVNAANGQTFNKPWTLSAAPSNREKIIQREGEAIDQHVNSEHKNHKDSSAVPHLKSKDRLFNKGSLLLAYLQVFPRQKSTKSHTPSVAQSHNSAQDGKTGMSGLDQFSQHKETLTQTSFDSSPSVSHGARSRIQDQTEINKHPGIRTREHGAAGQIMPGRSNTRSKRSPRNRGHTKQPESDSDRVTPHSTVTVTLSDISEASSGSREPHTEIKPDRVKAGSKIEDHSTAERQTGPMVQEDKAMGVTPTIYFGLDGKPLNMTEFYTFLKNNDFRRRLQQEAQWAYVCLVFLICLMMWLMWCLGGLERCRYRPDTVGNFSDGDFKHTLSVPEVLKRKQQYLPMFNEPEWEDVLFCNRGSDP